MSAKGVVAIDPRNRIEGDLDLIYGGCDRITIAGQGMQMSIVRSATSG
ncbi:hypothetical protein [Aliiroseovarius sediminis]|nr:hypothetical protein [Aliiroseovarius sediminis]MCI2396006.1 hypothetical protein [Aliiroseovarius sediminis]